MNKKLAVIGAADFQLPLIKKAKSLGYEVHCFAWAEGAVAKDHCDYFYPISIVEKEEILEKCKRIQPDGICSIASDLAAITVNYVAENLGLPCNSTEYVPIQTNKYLMRQALSDAGIPCPKFLRTGTHVDLSLLEDFTFPVIVKPTDRSGSRAIMKLDSLDGIQEAVQAACEASFEKQAIIEEYLTGNEYSMESISYQGKHHFLAVTKKFTTGAPHFIETGHIQPSDLPAETIEKVKTLIFAALDVLHIENSAGHAEFKVDHNGNVHIIEIGARMGGDCIGSDLVYLSTGNDFVKMVIDVSCGQAPEIMIPKSNSASIRFIFDENDLEALSTLEKTSPASIVRVSQIDMQNLGKITDSSTRLGYFITKN